MHITALFTLIGLVFSADLDESKVEELERRQGDREFLSDKIPRLDVESLKSIKSNKSADKHTIVFYYMVGCPHSQDYKEYLNTVVEHADSFPNTTFAAVRCMGKDDKELCQNIKAFPTFIMYPEDKEVEALKIVDTAKGAKSLSEN